MVTEIRRTVECAVPAEVAFAYVADYRNVPQWLVGLSDFTPVGGRDAGLGAVFDATVHLGVRLSARVEVGEFVPGRRMGFASTRGLSVRSRWDFEPLGPGHARVTAQLAYRLPLGPAGLALGRVIEPFVQQSFALSSGRLTAAMESWAPRSEPAPVLRRASVCA